MPVIVTAKVRFRFKPVARTVIVDVEDVGLDEKVSLSPDELSVAERLTDPVNPPCGVIVTV